MRKKELLLLSIVVMLAVVILVNPAFAYGEQIESSLNNLLNWITKILGGLAVGFGLVFTGIRVSLGDERAFQKGGAIVGGGILIFSAMHIVNLLQAIFK